MCTNRWGTYKAHSNHQLWSQQPNTQKSPNYCHDNYESSSFSQHFWSRQLLYKKFMYYVHRNQSRFLSVYRSLNSCHQVLRTSCMQTLPFSLVYFAIRKRRKMTHRCFSGSFPPKFVNPSSYLQCKND